MDKQLFMDVLLIVGQWAEDSIQERDAWCWTLMLNSWNRYRGKRGAQRPVVSMQDIVDGINGKFKLRRVMQSLYAGDSGNSMAMPSSLHVSPCNRVGRATEHLCM